MNRIFGGMICGAAFVACAAVACGGTSSDVVGGESAVDTVTAVDASSNATSSADTPTYHETIEAIVQRRCQSCHHDGGIAPFSMTTYAQVASKGAYAKYKVDTREMPPWGVSTSETCASMLPLTGDLAMPESEIELFDKWVVGGMPEGDPAKAPAPLTFAKDDGLAGATHTLSLTAPYAVAPGTTDEFRCFPLDPKSSEDLWLTGSNVIPGDSRVVHHVVLFPDPERLGVVAAGAEGSYPCSTDAGVNSPPVLAWAPGVGPAEFQAGAGIKIPGGSHFVAQIHYHPSSETVTDQTKVQLRMTNVRPKYVAQFGVVGQAGEASNDLGVLQSGPADPPSGPLFLVPANAPRHTETVVLKVPEDWMSGGEKELRIASVFPHMHWAGADIQVNLSHSNHPPADDCLIGVPRYNFNWQRTYRYELPYESLPTVSAGDTIKLTCTYNNTKNNPFVLKALNEERRAEPHDIELGEATNEEMCIAIFWMLRPIRSTD